MSKRKGCLTVILCCAFSWAVWRIFPQNLIERSTQIIFFLLLALSAAFYLWTLRNSPISSLWRYIVFFMGLTVFASVLVAMGGVYEVYGYLFCLGICALASLMVLIIYIGLLGGYNGGGGGRKPRRPIEPIPQDDRRANWRYAPDRSLPNGPNRPPADYPEYGEFMSEYEKREQEPENSPEPDWDQELERVKKRR